MESEVWRGSSLTARAIMLELVRRHDGFNNGRIGASQRDLAAALNTTNLRAIGAACAELIERGFLAIEREAERWNRHAREYRVTWLPMGEPPNRRPPGDEWRAFSSDDEASSRNLNRDDEASSRTPPLDDKASSRILASRQKTAKPLSGS
jgi:hypothetical protein